MVWLSKPLKEKLHEDRDFASIAHLHAQALEQWL